ncbi:MAG: cytochrome c3 family protein [Bdellovibrionota bacterium]
MKTGKVPQQVVVLGVIFVIIIVGFVAMRWFFVPATFGKYGHYRAAALDEVRQQEVVFAGAKACADCHDDIYKNKSRGFHRNVSCEVCHGPAAAHAEDPSSHRPEAPRQRGLCPLCHNYSPSRPTGFPQIITVQHNPGKACMSCHNPHNPVTPQPPKECSACHRSIANQKMVSHHASLECTTCHEAGKDHINNPRFSRVSKPTTNEFCGKCHASGDAVKTVKGMKVMQAVPQIDIEAHAGRYLCWDCHYPHYPEAKP